MCGIARRVTARRARATRPSSIRASSGQHYRYLLREEVAIRDGERRNANPKMVRLIKGYSDADLQAVADYISQLPVTRK